ncbi:MAG TPA: methyltransferase domain-containing protein [Candidatus Sulfotelmatobacter sp.]|jgi:SAM-dependent methyltransferase|nr:methyltransferase domain-containing protein [Candidatus Sulfotelmatobacter sp.]
MDKWTSGAHYDQWMGRWSRLLAQEFLQWLELSAGLRWMDVCCGSGVVTEAIVELNLPAAVVGVDASTEQVTFARNHRTHHNVIFDTADAMALPFPDSSFDVVVCGLGLNFVPNPLKALDEFSRVARPGGTIAVYVWDYVQSASFLRYFWDAAIAIDGEAATFDQAYRFPMCTPEGLRNLFEQAKLEDLSQHTLNVLTRFTNFDDFWQPLLTGQGSAPGYLAVRDPQIQAAIRERLRSALPTDARGAIELPARAWAIRARKKV